MSKYLTLLALTVGAPIITAYIKQLLPQLPKKWIPLIAPMIGGLAEGLYRLTVSDPTLPEGTMVAAGAAGVALREVVDQWRRDGVDRFAAVAMVPLLLVGSSMLVGCSAQSGSRPPRDLGRDCRIAEIVANGAMPILQAKCAQAKEPLTDGYCLAIVGTTTAIAACYEAAQVGNVSAVDDSLERLPEPPAAVPPTG